MISTSCLAPRSHIWQILIRRGYSASAEPAVYDVVIHGGGAVGASLAVDLMARSQGRLKVCLIEANNIRHVTTSQPDPRVYALSPRSINTLDRLGAWKHVVERSHPYSSMQIWEATGPGIVKFRSTDVKKTELGRICEDATIQAALYKVLSEQEQKVDVMSQSSILEIQLPPTGNSSKLAELRVKKTENGEESEVRLSTRLLVGADGANSLVRRLTGIPSWGWSYGQEAVVCSVSLLDVDQQAAGAGKTFENPTAWQRYLPTGPLALLPCWQGYSSIVWSVPPPEARRLKALSTEDFLTELNAALRSPINLNRSSKAHTGEDESDDERPSRPPRGIFPPWAEAVLDALDGPAAGLRKGSKEAFKGLTKEFSAASEAMLAMAQLRDPYTAPPLVKQISGPRLSFPLNFQQAKYYALSRCALIGDAAHSIHPQAGQGLNLGFQDAGAMCSHVIRALEAGHDIGHQSVLQDYANERFTRNLAMMGLVDIINATFKDSLVLGDQVAAANRLSPDSPAVRAKRFLRSMGMLGINNSAMLKAEIAKFAMGTD